MRWGWGSPGLAHDQPSPSPSCAECVLLAHRTPEDLSRFVVELQQRELALKDRNSSITSR